MVNAAPVSGLFKAIGHHATELHNQFDGAVAQAFGTSAEQVRHMEGMAAKGIMVGATAGMVIESGALALGGFELMKEWLLVSAEFGSGVAAVTSALLLKFGARPSEPQLAQNTR